jgi:hypothetical protein
MNNTLLIGFGTNKGSVIASKRGVKKIQHLEVRPAIDEGWDKVLYNI